MILSNKKRLLINATLFFFLSFLLVLPIFGGLGRVNNLFHLSAFLLVVVLIGNHGMRSLLFAEKKFNVALAVTALFLAWFTASNLWGAGTGSLLSTLTHSLYLLIFILLYALAQRLNKKQQLLSVLFLAMNILLVLTLIWVDKKTLFSLRLENGFPGAPDNVIDMAGYYGIGIFCGLILIRDTGKKWLYLPTLFLLSGLLLTLSRGPLFSLILSCLPLLFLFKRIHRSHLLIALAAIVGFVLIIAFTNVDQKMVQRLAIASSQIFIRVGIWENALSLFEQKMAFGWGFDKQLDFVNSIGQRVHTTHSLYFGTLLKGGVVGGMLLLALIGYGFYMAWQQVRCGQALEAAMFLFSLLFYASQGMFVVGNPGESWLLFWLPLAVVFTLPARHLGQPPR